MPKQTHLKYLQVWLTFTPQNYSLMIRFSILFVFGMLLYSSSIASDIDTVNNFKIKTYQPKRFYVGNGYDFATLSTALISKPGANTELTPPRFTAIVNIGVHFNYDLNKQVGVFTGISLRNLGFIEFLGNVHIKRRVYALSVPLAIKIGDLRNRNFVFAGGGVDIPFYYKEKVFIKRADKQKSGDWFADNTPRVLPYIFAGLSFDPGITFKLQYYPTNFLNTDFVDYDAFHNAYKPYAGYKVNLLMLSLGIDIHYGQYKIQEREYQKMKKEREAAQRL